MPPWALNGLDFGGVGTYDLDGWPLDDPRYGECTAHMLLSGEWTYNAQPTNRDGTINFNDPLSPGAPSNLGVFNIDEDGHITGTANSWTYTGDYLIPDWGTDTAITNLVTCGSVAGPTPPGPGESYGLSLSVTRAGNFFIQGQIVTHSERTGATYHGGALTWHVEVDPGGLWYCEAFSGSSLARTWCGEHWGGGELVGATFGQGAQVGGSPPTAVVLLTSCGGASGVRSGPAECPHAPPPFAPGGRGYAVLF